MKETEYWWQRRLHKLWRIRFGNSYSRLEEALAALTEPRYWWRKHLLVARYLMMGWARTLRTQQGQIYQVGRVDSNLKLEGWGINIHDEATDSSMRYEIGFWKEGALHGYGITQGASGCKYIGEFFFGNRSGVGELRLPNGDTFQGVLFDNHKLQGLYTSHQGWTFQGTYSQDKKKMGTLTWLHTGFSYTGKSYRPPPLSLQVPLTTLFLVVCMISM